jgi:hypothetical protein
MNHVFEEIQTPPVYVGQNGEPGIMGWMEVHPWINPNAELETFQDQVAIRQTWMAICRLTIFENTLTYPGGWPAALMNRFDALYDSIRDNLGCYEDLNQMWDYDSFVSELEMICIQAFQSAKAVYEDILAHAECLETVSGMGLRLDDQEKTFLKAIRATRDNH